MGKRVPFQAFPGDGAIFSPPFSPAGRFLSKLLFRAACLAGSVILSGLIGGSGGPGRGTCWALYADLFLHLHN